MPKITFENMKNKILLIIELILPVAALTIGGLWVIDPNENYEPFLAVMGIVLALLELCRRLSVRSNTVEKTKKIYARRYLDQPHHFHFIKGLPSLRNAAHENAQELWDSGITANMRQGSYDYIDFLQDIWVRLAEFYPPLHFGGLEPREYISKFTRDRFSHHRVNLEPEGPNTGGTIVGVIAGGNVIYDLEEMIDDQVCNLSLNSESFDYQHWKKRWQGKA